MPTVFTPRVLKRIWSTLRWKDVFRGSLDAPTEEAFVAYFIPLKADLTFRWSDQSNGLSYAYDLSINQVQVNPFMQPYSQQMEEANRWLWKLIPPEFLDAPTDWSTLWFEAANRNDTARMEFILEQGFDVNTVDGYPSTIKSLVICVRCDIDNANTLPLNPTVMKKAQLEKLIASVNFTPLAPLTEEERSALQQFKDCHEALRRLEDEKRTLKNERQREKNQGRSSSVAMPPQEKVLFDNRKKRIKSDVDDLAKRYSMQELQDRHDFEISKTIWTIIDDYEWAEERPITHYTSRASMEHNIFNILHVGSSVLEVFINGRRLTKSERDEFMDPMIQEEEDHRANSPFHQMFGH